MISDLLLFFSTFASTPNDKNIRRLISERLYIYCIINTRDESLMKYSETNKAQIKREAIQIIVKWYLGAQKYKSEKEITRKTENKIMNDYIKKNLKEIQAIKSKSEKDTRKQNT